MTGLATRYVWIVWPDADGIRIKITCLEKGMIEEKGVMVPNPRSPEAGAEKWFLLENSQLKAERVASLMYSLTDDQIDSFYPQAPVIRSKKAKAK